MWRERKCCVPVPESFFLVLFCVSVFLFLCQFHLNLSESSSIGAPWTNRASGQDTQECLKSFFAAKSSKAFLGFYSILQYATECLFTFNSTLNMYICRVGIYAISLTIDTSHVLTHAYRSDTHANLLTSR